MLITFLSFSALNFDVFDNDCAFTRFMPLQERRVREHWEHYRAMLHGS